MVFLEPSSKGPSMIRFSRKSIFVVFCQAFVLTTSQTLLPMLDGERSGWFTQNFGFSLAVAKPKYGPAEAPRATPLSRSHQFFSSGRASAPDFWRLIPYYVPQSGGAACGVASVSMMLNGFVSRRNAHSLGVKGSSKASGSQAVEVETSDDKLVLQGDLLDQVKVEDWKKRILGGEGAAALTQIRGTDLDTLGRIVTEAMKVYRFEGAKVEVVHLDGASPKDVNQVRQVLKANEKGDRDLIIANFLQSSFTDDADAGHLAPVGAYDEKTDRVLILDPDREYYEPYWISTETFVKGMATLDSTVKKNRGYLRVTLKE
jgi:hypothetical protein